MKKYVVGVDIGPSKTLCGLFDDQMRLVRVIQRPTDAELPADALMDALDAYVRELARGAGVALEEVRGMGAAFPSHVDFAEGVLLETADLYQLNDTPVRDMLQKRLSLPIFIENDSNAAALAEHRLGAGRGVRDMIYVTVSTGVGGGADPWRRTLPRHSRQRRRNRAYVRFRFHGVPLRVRRLRMRGIHRLGREHGQIRHRPHQGGRGKPHSRPRRHHVQHRHGGRGQGPGRGRSPGHRSGGARRGIPGPHVPVPVSDLRHQRIRPMAAGS